jgi:hypothetical protein
VAGVGLAGFAVMMAKQQFDAYQAQLVQAQQMQAQIIPTVEVFVAQKTLNYGDMLTAVDLRLEVTGKGTLRMTLPEGSDLFNVLVNDEGAPLVREGGDWLFHVFPSPETGRPSSVRFVYSSPAAKGKLTGPVLDVPMENLEWRVLVPEGWRLDKHKGDFDLKQQSSLGSFRLEDYQSFVIEKRGNDARSAVALLDQANAWLSQGDQEKAGLALSNAARSSVLDEASNEDARVQLRQLKTQQAVLGLNTRRQRVTLDNRADAPGAANPQLERAALANPVLRGDYNYDPRLFDRFLEGNTADENTALKEIANRIVTQQLAAEPAPVALDITLPERGKVVTFTRSVQVGGSEQPMEIDITLKKTNRASAWLAIPLCLLLGAIAARRKEGLPPAARQPRPPESRSRNHESHEWMGIPAMPRKK